MTTTNLPKITAKQQEILRLLYKHRFLNRIQIQKFLEHKDYKTVNVWLKDLRENHYVEWIYSTDFAEKTKPGIYYLGINAIRHFKALSTYPVEELRKRYRESTRSQTYIDRCILLADCCIDLEKARDEGGKIDSWYFYETETEYLSESYLHFITESELIHPDLCFSKEVYDGLNEPCTEQAYLWEIFDSLPRYRRKKRLSDYVKYLDEEEWDPLGDVQPLPVILLVCSKVSDLAYAKRRTRDIIAIEWEHDDKNRPRIRFTTVQKLKRHGVLNAEIWDDV